VQRYQAGYLILVTCAMAAAIGALLLFGARPAQSAPSTGTLRYVAKGGVDASNDCLTSGSPCATIQRAVDISSPNDEIRVATGTYSDTHVKPKADVSTTGTVTQVVYITQSLSIRGGFTTTNWSTQNINANPTILDGGNSARVLYVTGHVTPTVEGFQIKRGDAFQQRGVTDFQDFDAGSGIYVITASLTLSASVVSNNNPAHPPFAGGGMYVYYGRATLISDTFQSNVAVSSGGGLYAAYAHSIISNSLFLSNSVTGGDGGGIYGVQSSYDSSISYSSIISNSAQRGGGIYLYDDDTPLTANLIMSNTASYQGGGIWMTGGGGYDDLINNVIADNVNTTNDGGGGAYFESSHLFLTHNTFARNKGGGAGIYISNAGIPAFRSDATMINSIIFSHTVGITLTHASTNTTSIDGVLWFNNGTNYGGIGIFTVTHPYTGNPAFATDRYHLTGASAAIDRGVSAGITTDIDGEARPKGAAPDLGADEFPSQSLYLPLILK
jgi:hypothetical protein